VLAALVVGPFVPRIPGVDDETGVSFAAGSDWDRQWEMAAVGSVYARRAAAPHWDPYAGGGSPLLANPEAFVMHPAFLLGARRGPATGMRALMLSSWVALFVGLAWLGALARVPWPLAAASGLLAAGSFEVSARIGSGHLMVLGVAWWPLLLASAVDGLRESRRHRPIETGLLGACCGAAIALCSLGGGHYATVFGILLLLLVLWSAPLPRWLPLALLAVFSVPIVVPAPAALIPLTVAGGLLIGWGLWLGRGSLRQAATLGAGVFTGLFAVTGARLTSALVTTASSGRLEQTSGLRHSNEVLDLTLLAQGGAGRLEDVLWFEHAWLWPLLVVGLAVWLWRLPALGFALVASLLVGWTAGRGSMPWGLLGWIPGMSAINEPERLQWVVLLAPLGLLAAVSPLLPRKRNRVLAVSAALAIAAAWQVGQQRPAWLPANAASTDPWPAASGQVLQATNDSNRHLSRGPFDGTMNTKIELALRFESPPEESGTGLARRYGQVGWGDDLVGVEGDLRDWGVRAQGRDALAIRQNALRGWSCTGGRVLQPGQGAWLRVEPNEEGLLRCSWTSPGWRVGLALQFVGIAAVLAGLWVTRRGGRTRQLPP